MGPNIPGSFCRQNKPLSKSICQLETRSFGSGDRCIQCEVGKLCSICVSPVLPHREMSLENSKRQVWADHDYATVANSKLVATNPSDEHNGSYSVAENTEDDHRSTRGEPSTSGNKHAQLGSVEGCNGLSWYCGPNRRLYDTFFRQ